MPSTYAVIMAGGSGTRFWPASREMRPKQLLALSGGEMSLLAATVQRIAPLVGAERVLVVTAGRLLEETRAAVPELLPEHILGEPAARNTAPCVAWATAVIRAKEPDARVIVLPSDHFIGDAPGFLQSLRAALASADEGFVTTLGIVPTRPETGYGYIEQGAKANADAYAVERFVEKPKLEVAKEYVASGKYLWNAGMFIFQAETMWQEFVRHMPTLAEGVVRMLSLEADGAAEARQQLLAEVFPTLTSVSIDVGVMEKCERLRVVPADIGWNDVGSWESAWELATKDGEGNAVRGNALCIAGSNNLVWDLRTKASESVLATVGLSGMVVVQTDDAILVIPREKAQDVRAIVDALKTAGRKTLV